MQKVYHFAGLLSISTFPRLLIRAVPCNTRNGIEIAHHNPDSPVPIPINTPERTSPPAPGLFAHPPNNPPMMTSNMINITVENGEATQIVLMDASGRTIKTVATQGAENHTIDVSALSTGIYFVNVRNENVSKVSKLIIQ